MMFQLDKQVAYQVDVRSKEASVPADTPQLAHVPPCVRQILDLHSGSGGVCLETFLLAALPREFKILLISSLALDLLMFGNID
jgi:hypothetical protein